MEINSLNLETSTRLERSRVSSFEVEPTEFKRWINNTHSGRQIRIDTPVNRDADGPQDHISPQDAPKSIYGVCQPIKKVLAPRDASPASQTPSAPLMSSEQITARLCRLLQKQQEWYDVEQAARARAENYLDIIEQYQKQWLSYRPSTSRENS